MTLVDVTSAPLPRLPARPADSHKGDFGRALLIGGSCGMSGAISLAGLATLRSGAGLVTLAVPRTIQDVVSSFNPCLMTRGLSDDGTFVVEKAGDEAIKSADQITAGAIGPGLGRGSGVRSFVMRVCEELAAPMVVDADALFALAEGASTAAAGPRIFTPHSGEFARLTGKRTDPTQRIEEAAALSRKWSATGGSIIVVLKGRNTVVTDGSQFSVNHTGNPGMATGGTGDVLTGVITGLLCQGLAPFDAARLGVHVHGRAGDLAAEKLGQISLIASDVIEFLPNAFQSLQENN